LPSTVAVIVLLDLRTSIPLAILDGTYITAVRTGAAGAVAASVLARKDSKTVGLIGAGTQDRMQVLALNEIYLLRKAPVFDKVESSRGKYAAEMSKRLGIDVQAVDNAKDTVSNADIIVTVTPSRQAIVKNE
jgi:ornithine cyclodeaminase/alanine dehydrogenase-like protein (mu-crystallin family)